MAGFGSAPPSSARANSAVSGKLRVRAVERGAIPVPALGRRIVGRLSELEQRRLGGRSRANNLVGQDELSHFLVVVSPLGPHLVLRISGRLRVGVGIEGRLPDRSSARPEPAAAALV